MTTEQPKPFYENFSKTNRDWFEARDGVKYKKYAIEKSQRPFWNAVNPLRKLWPADLKFCPDSENKMLYYALDKRPVSISKTTMRKHPHLVREALQLLVDILDRKVPLEKFPDKNPVIKVSSDGHLIVLPQKSVKFGTTLNYLALQTISKIFDGIALQKAQASEDFLLMIKVHALLGEQKRTETLELLASYCITPTPIIDPAAQELDLCGVTNSGELMQRIADHPAYTHLVQDEHGEIRDEISLDKNPLMIQVQELLEAKQIQDWEELENHFELDNDEDEDLGQIASEFMDISDVEEEEEDVQSDAQYVTLDGGMRVMLTAEDWAAIKANHTTSTTRTMDIYYPDSFSKTEFTMEMLSVSISIERFVDPRAYFDDAPAIVKRERPDAADLVLPESSPKYIRLD